MASSAIWAVVVGLASFLGRPMRHAMHLGLVTSIGYAIYRERRRRRVTDLERIEHRQRWRKPIDWTRRARRPEPAVRGTGETGRPVPHRRRGPLGGHLLSNRSSGEVLLWIIVVAVMATAFVAWIAHAKNLA